jgi:flagellar hook-associated protein 1 FlgK
VIDRARDLAAVFQQAAASLARASTDADRQIQQTVSQINQLGARLLEYNLQRRRGAVDDAGLDAKIQTTLEELSEFVDFTAMFQPDGSVSVLLGGQTPLVIGDRHFEISVSSYYPTNPPPVYPAAAPPVHILGAEGRDITSHITEGRLGGLLNIRNSFLPSLRGDAYQAGDLNLLAKTVADRVNQILTSGRVSDGPPPETGVALFTYDATNDAAAAESLTLNSAITPALLAAIDPGPPYVSNGTALQLAGLANPQDAADRINGFSFTEFYGSLAARVGRELTDMRDNETLKAQMVAQARNLRSEISGVSLDEEAILMIEFQRAYQANARMVSVLNDLTEIAVNLVR